MHFRSPDQAEVVLYYILIYWENPLIITNTIIGIGRFICLELARWVKYVHVKYVLGADCIQ